MGGLTRPLAVTASAVALGLGVWQAPRALAALDFFAVERVELRGARYLAPHAVLDAAAIDESVSVFGDLAGWAEQLRSHPLIEEAAVTRRLPRTLVVEIREIEPVAMAPLPELRPVDAAGRILPLEPAGLVLDLPVLLVTPGAEDARAGNGKDAAEDGGHTQPAQDHVAEVTEPDGADALEPRAADPLTAALARLLGQLLHADAALAARVSEAHATAGGATRLLLREPEGGEAWLAADAGAIEFARLAATLADLEARGETRRRPRLDLRYREQVVVSFE